MVSPDATATRRGRHAPGGGAPLFLVGPLYTPSLILSCSLFSSLEILHLFHFHDALKTGLPHALVERGILPGLSRGRLWAAAWTRPLMCTLPDPRAGAANRPVRDRSFGSSRVSPIPLSCGPLIVSVAHSMLPLVYVGLMWVLAPIFSCRALLDFPPQ